MPISLPTTLNTYINRWWFEGIALSGNPQRTVIQNSFPFNTVWEQNPPQFGDIVQFRGIYLLPGNYTLNMIYIDGPSATDEIVLGVGPPSIDTIQRSIHTITLNNPPVTEAVQYTAAGIEINEGFFNLYAISNFAVQNFTAASFISLTREIP